MVVNLYRASYVLTNNFQPTLSHQDILEHIDVAKLKKKCAINKRLQQNELQTKLLRLGGIIPRKERRNK
jgi:hypothetical protein